MLEHEILKIRNEILNSWIDVQSKLEYSRNAILQGNKELALLVLIKENFHAFDLKATTHFEYIFTLPGRTSSQLHFLLAILKINNYLRQVGHLAESIAITIIESSVTLRTGIIDKTHLLSIYDDVIKLTSDIRIAFDQEDSPMARTIFKRIETIENLGGNMHRVISDMVREKTTSVDEAIYTTSIIRKLLSVSDQIKDMTSEIILLLEAKKIRVYEDKFIC